MSNIHLVAATLIEQDEDVLLVQEGKEHVRGLWNLPAGGVEDSETPQDAAIREAQEEAGVAVELLHFIGAYHQPRREKPDALIVVFHGQTVDDHTTPEDDEILDVQYFNPAALDRQDLRSPYIEEAIDDYLSGHRYPISTVQSL